MKGITIDCKTGKINLVDDGKPMPEYTPFVMPEGLDLEKAAQAIKDIDQLKADVAELKAKP